MWLNILFLIIGLIIVWRSISDMIHPSGMRGDKGESPAKANETQLNDTIDEIKP
jgi:hypothetical protein